MKKSFVAATAALLMMSTSNGSAQEIEQDPAPGQAGLEADPEFPSGQWNFVSGNEMALTTNLPTRGPKFVWHIGTSVFMDNNVSGFFVTADGRKLSTPVIEGTYAPIHAKDVSLSRYGSGQQFAGQWRVKHPGANPFAVIRTQWEGAPTKTQLLLALDAPRYMTVSMNPNQNCSNGRMYLIIDGKKQVGPDGSALVWYAGNTVLTYGKTVEVEVQGNCPANQFFSGELYYELPVAKIK